MNTGVEKVLNALNSGQALTTKQISARYGLANPRDAIYTLRNEGYSINLVETVDAKGRTSRKYQMSNAKKR